MRVVRSTLLPGALVLGLALAAVSAAGAGSPAHALQLGFPSGGGPRPAANPLPVLEGPAAMSGPVAVAESPVLVAESPTAGRWNSGGSARAAQPNPDVGGQASPDAALAQLLLGWGPAANPLVDPRRFTEAHWQGLEVVPNTPALAAALNLPADVPGVIVDDVTLPADLQGFVAGDVVTHVNRVPTPDLMSFIRATARVRDQNAAGVTILREARLQTVKLAALLDRLGTANGETPSMIPPNARMPHAYRGPCTNCHRIGTTGTLNADQGDPLNTPPPSIRVGAVRPHVDRGPCATCHQILP